MENVLLVGSREELEQPLRALAAAEFRIHVVENGYAALEALETFDPAIAIILGSSSGLDGIELSRHLKEVNPDLEVIFIAGENEQHRILEALELGVCDSIRGPLSDKALTVLLRRAQQRLWKRRRLIEALEEIQKRHEFEYKLIHTSMDGIIANDRQGNLILFNEGASRIYGYTPEEALAKIHVTQLYPEGQAYNIKKQIYGPDYGGAGRLINFETMAVTNEGRLKPILLSASLIYEGNEEVATVGYFKDLTELKRAA